MSSFVFYLSFIILIVFGFAINQESLSFTLIDLSFLTIGQSILCLISGIVLKIKHNPSFFSFFRNKYFYLHVFLASIVTFFLFYFLILFMNSYTLNGQEFELKSFHKKTIEEASIELEKLGLEYQIAYSVYTDSVPKGTIFKQHPIPGTFVKKGRTVYFTLNHSNPQYFKVPDIYNQSEVEAINQLSPYFTVEFVKSENYTIDYTVTELISGGAILAVGDTLEKGSTIIVYFEDEVQPTKPSVDILQNIDSTIIE